MSALSWGTAQTSPQPHSGHMQKLETGNEAETTPTQKSSSSPSRITSSIETQKNKTLTLTPVNFLIAPVSIWPVIWLLYFNWYPESRSKLHGVSRFMTKLPSSEFSVQSPAFVGKIPLGKPNCSKTVQAESCSEDFTEQNNKATEKNNDSKQYSRLQKAMACTEKQRADPKFTEKYENKLGDLGNYEQIGFYRVDGSRVAESSQSGDANGRIILQAAQFSSNRVRDRISV